MREHTTTSTEHKAVRAELLEVTQDRDRLMLAVTQVWWTGHGRLWLQRLRYIDRWC